ncbi:hypothetical protein BKI52_44175 [marine bacterium AO1-C]|nr:hypothetical protein BKI52_44175 [marine bacterium AO1-C]
MIIIVAALTTYFLIFYNLLDRRAKVKDNCIYFIAALFVSYSVATIAFTNTYWVNHFVELYTAGILAISVLIIIKNRPTVQEQAIQVNPDDSLATVNYKVIELNKHCQRISSWLQNIKHQQVLIWQNPQTSHLQNIRKLERELASIEQQITHLTEANQQAVQMISARLDADVQYPTLCQQLKNNLNKLPQFQKKLKQLKHLVHLVKDHVLHLLNAQKLSDKAIAAIERIAQKGQKLWNTYDDLSEEHFWKKYNQLIAQTKQVQGV